MSKSKEELNQLKKQYEELNEKCKELTIEELEQVTGGISTMLAGKVAGVQITSD
ncbi:MAG: class IIb bacteriocin, lactobin A/cerein 7B family [Lachnospiraceae bacterium]|nr:class IIb bacteriocin, lactobin A/cerein 7B family [Lachnospiraceae bacterium]